MDSKTIDGLKNDFRESAAAVMDFGEVCAEPLELVAQLTVEKLRNGGKLVVFGNGGSASDALHLVAEFVGRYLVDRKPLPAIALVDNAATLTAIANDYGYSEVFARQVNGLCEVRDVVVGISTSGKSENVVRGLEEARGIGSYTVGLCGAEVGDMANFCDALFCAPTKHTPRIQECHGVWIHLFCQRVESILFGGKG